ncbi:relaxin receptor 1-like [Uloborus diversus]|uniref:relaxin receptor 1-like n=1 Tax=Uloborus diversus TaxID=327109 RepID=UPI0024098868|nr:relaxin receptor 1-like [Uloborus diversus]XP_054718334.1 relaxin receptor 1-like [Uloborus diversus]
MTYLLTLDLQDNGIYTIEVDAFDMLKRLDSLNLKNNPLRHMQAACFNPLISLRYIYFSSFYSCSIARKVRVCEPRGDGLSSQSHLLDNVLARAGVWIVAGIACLGNAAVIIGRAMIVIRRETDGVHAFYIKNLSVADFLMCLYLFLIAGHDVAFRGEYIRYDVKWRHSWQCTLAGMLSTVSSEASVFILTLITADRYISIVYPLMMRRRTLLWAVFCVGASWSAALAIAILPTLNFGYFGDDFYGNNGVCLPLHIHDPFSRGWEYSMVIFCGINTVAFGFVSYAYIAMFLTISRSRLGLRSSQQQLDRTLAKRFAFIVATDMACWLPIILIKICAVSGIKIPSELYAWVAVFLLPIHSALNPLLYTLTTRLFRQQLARIVYTWRTTLPPSAESSGISMSSAPGFHHSTRSKNSINIPTSDLDRSLSRTSLISANSRISGRCNWPSPLAYIVYQNNCF